jgi:hypothetical protein
MFLTLVHTGGTLRYRVFKNILVVLEIKAAKWWGGGNRGQRSLQIYPTNIYLSRFQLSRGLSRVSAAAHLLGFRLESRRWHGCVCCVLSDRGLCVGPITHPEIYRVRCV